MIGKNLLVLVLVALALMPAGTTAKEWQQLVEGDIVTFLIPLDAPQPNLTTDTVILTGGKVLEIDIVACGVGTHPVQNYTIIDATGSRSPRNGGIIPVTTEPVRPGTRLGALTFDTQCSINGVEYVRYQGTVE